MKTDNWELYYSFLIISSIFFLGSTISFFFHLVEVNDFLSNSGQTEGVIVKASKIYFEDDSVDRVTIKYSVQDTLFFSEKDMNTKNDFYKEKFYVGDKISILYNRDNPNISKVNSFNEIYVELLAIGIAGIASLLITILTYKYKSWVLRQDGGNWPYG